MPAPVVLASASPRRRALLAQIGIACEPCPVEIDESRRPGESPEGLAARLATAKAEAGARATGSVSRPVLGADTVVALGDETFGKPADAQEAADMLRALSGCSHRVITAVVGLYAGRRSERLSTTRVEFRSLAEAEIAAYVASGEPLDKAGAYGIQGRAAIFVQVLHGSYTGVVGLPLCETALILRELGVDVLSAGTPA
jgi:septum formation protein